MTVALTIFAAVAVLVAAGILWELYKMSEALDRLTNEVTEQTSVIGSAVTLLGQLAQEIRDNTTDPAALNELADRLDANSNALAEAITANTPAEEPTEPTPPEEPTA